MEDSNKSAGQKDLPAQQDLSTAPGVDKGDNVASDVEKETKKKETRILPDTSWLVALLDDTDVGNAAAKASFGAVTPYKPIFYVPAIVYMETLSRLVRGKMTVKKCCELMREKFFNQINFRHSTMLGIDQIENKYKQFAKAKMKSLKPADFWIATEGIAVGAKILTSDYEMYEKTLKYYKNIYFISDQSDKKTSDLPKLVKDVQSANGRS